MINIVKVEAGNSCGFGRVLMVHGVFLAESAEGAEEEATS